MNRSVIETLLGAVVLFVAGSFLVFSYNTANVKPVSGYDIFANFTTTGGLATGDAVQVSGVKVGTVSGIELDPNTYLARVKISLGKNIKLPVDTSAVISSESLLGGRFLMLEPGGDEEYLKDGDIIQFSQSPQNLEQLLGKFIFSMESGADKTGGGDTDADSP